MAPRPPLAEQVVVITGASSGIGRETAFAMARRGARVVLAARGERALREVADAIAADGGEAHVVRADVADWEQVSFLGDAAISRFGRIDTWVNNAAVSVYATFAQLAVHEIDRVLAVALTGTIYGTRAALAHMIPRGEGTIICVGSVLGERSFPLMSMYCAAKRGVEGFTEAVRLELAREHPGITLTTISPASIDTPFYAHARSKLGVRPKPFPPVYPARAVADAILDAATHRRRKVYVGGSGAALVAAQKLSPALVDRALLHRDVAVRHMLSDEPDHGQDNLFTSADETTAPSGAPRWHVLRGSAYTRLVERGRWRALALGAAAVGVVAAAALRRR